MSDNHSPPPKPREDYWSVARQPLHCLLFLVPLLAVYEFGVYVAADEAGDSARNGADYWMRTGLRLAGLESPYLLPLVIVGLLAVWHAIGRYRWKPSAATLFGMFAESVLFGVCLVVLGQLQDLAFRSQLAQDVVNDRVLLDAVPLSQPGILPAFISFVGAGVYEEVLFRLCLLPVAYGVLRAILMPRQPAIVLAVLGTSVLFSLAHYVGPAADHFTLFSFVFRASAGVFFAVLFVLRGFGITVGSHAAYDLLVGILIPTMGI